MTQSVRFAGCYDMRLPVAVLAVLRGTQCFACRSHFQIGSVAISQCSSMFLDVSFAMTLRGFDEVMASMDEALPNLERQDFEDRWASVMSCIRFISFLYCCNMYSCQQSVLIPSRSKLKKRIII